jgi:small-conductance mechanosensitive channel
VRNHIVLEAPIHRPAHHAALHQVELGAVGSESHNTRGPTARHAGRFQQLIQAGVINVDELSRRRDCVCLGLAVGQPGRAGQRSGQKETQEDNRQRRKSPCCAHGAIFRLVPGKSQAFQGYKVNLPFAFLFTFDGPCLVKTCKNISMAKSPVAPRPGEFVRPRLFGKTRLVYLVSLLAVLTLCVVFSFTTRDAMEHLSFLRTQAHAPGAGGGMKVLVDLRPWQTAQALAPLAVSAEENGYAREAERLADHEVDQAFAAALRKEGLEAENRKLTGEALALSQKVAQLNQLVHDDQAQTDRLTQAASSSAGQAKGAAQPAVNQDDVDIAKAQLGLDTDELADAQLDLDRASGDDRPQIQSELAAHEAAMRKLDSEPHSDGQTAVLSAGQHGTLAARIGAWNKQRERHGLIQQALAQTQADVASLTAEHNALEAAANGASVGGDAADRTATLANIKNKSAERQLLSIYDDRIQTEQQLAAVYEKWSAQLLLQHRILLHLMLQSVALIVLILLCMAVGDALVRRFMARPSLDRRQMRTLRTLLEVGTQVVGAALVLMVIFGSPQQLSTVLGLATAGLTIALQDFILAFFGWFALMGKNGMRVGDWVEIDGVGGEVTEIGLIYTSLLETGTLEDKGHPTGRRITFINSFAIRGKFFNFSTTGQWMWDEISLSVPASENAHAMVERIHKVVTEETEKNARLAEQEWRRGARGEGLSRFSAAPAVNLRPSNSGIDILVRYVTRASERFEVRNRIYQHVIDMLGEKVAPAKKAMDPVK